MTKGLIDRAKNPPSRIIEGEAYLEIANRINEQMEKVNRDFRYKNAQSKIDANYIFLTD